MQPEITVKPEEIAVLEGIVALIEQNDRRRGNWRDLLKWEADTPRVLETGRRNLRCDYDLHRIMGRRLNGAERKRIQRLIDSLEDRDLVTCGRGLDNERRIAITVSHAGCLAAGIDPSRIEREVDRHTFQRMCEVFGGEQ